MNQKLFIRALLTLHIVIFAFVGTKAKAQNTNAKQAQEIFKHTYNMVFGPQGCTLHYDVNLVGLYKTSGTIWYKGEKSKFVEGRYWAWNNGKTYYLVDTKKKTVTIHHADSDNKDKYSNHFKFQPDDYTYHVDSSAKEYLLTLRLKPGRKGMKLIKATINKSTRAPVSLKIKVAFFWANINISNFQSGKISDSLFMFPHKQYTGYKYIDKREE